MNNFLFENKTRFLFGGGCVKEYLASFLTGYGPSVLLVREEGDSRSGAVDEVRDILGLLTKWEFSTAEDGRKARKKTPLASIQTLYHSLEV